MFDVWSKHTKYLNISHWILPRGIKKKKKNEISSAVVNTHDKMPVCMTRPASTPKFSLMLEIRFEISKSDEPSKYRRSGFSAFQRNAAQKSVFLIWFIFYQPRPGNNYISPSGSKIDFLLPRISERELPFRAQNGVKNRKWIHRGDTPVRLAAQGS